jgi:hypothetical protein
VSPVELENAGADMGIVKRRCTRFMSYNLRSRQTTQDEAWKLKVQEKLNWK